MVYRAVPWALHQRQLSARLCNKVDDWRQTAEPGIYVYKNFAERREYTYICRRVYSWKKHLRGICVLYSLLTPSKSARRPVRRIARQDNRERR